MSARFPIGVATTYNVALRFPPVPPCAAACSIAGSSCLSLRPYYTVASRHWPANRSVSSPAPPTALPSAAPLPPPAPSTLAPSAPPQPLSAPASAPLLAPLQRPPTTVTTPLPTPLPPIVEGPHIALLLPLGSPAFGKHAEAVRNGFLAAAQGAGRHGAAGAHLCRRRRSAAGRGNLHQGARRRRARCRWPAHPQRRHRARGKRGGDGAHACAQRARRPHSRRRPSSTC